MTPALDVVIVNWNAGLLLQDCVRSIERVERRGFEFGQVVIVDNASTDGSVEGLASKVLPLKIVRNAENMGFAAACNQGAKESRADYLLFLNPDTRLFSDSLAVPLSFMEASQNRFVGICGIQLVDDDGNVSRSCARFPRPSLLCAWMLGLDKLLPQVFPGHLMKEWGHVESRDVDQVIGAFFLVRAGLFRQLGGFDERFFVYQEEVDFSLRASQQGWRSHYLADARAYHKGGGSSGQVKARRLFYSLRSRILYAYKHFGRAQASGVLLCTLLVEPFARIALNLLNGSIKSAAETLWAYLVLYLQTPKIVARALRG